MSGSASQTLITGVYRTGSEYIAQIVGCHPEIAVSMYGMNALRFVYGRFDPIERRDRYRAALEAIAERMHSRYQREVPVEALLSRLAAARRVTYGLLYDEVMCALYLQPPARHWAEKNQLLWREIPQFLASMPNGRAILVLRDPRSVLVSFKKYTYAPPPAYLGAVFNCLDAMQHAERYRDGHDRRVMVLRYEDAAREPQACAARIWSFLGLESGHEVADRGNWKDAYGRPWHANSSFHAAEDARPFDVANSIDRWKKEITPEELALTQAVCGGLMPAWGYPLAPAAGAEAGLQLAGDDPLVNGYIRHWLATGEGIQAFPTDPIDPKNWRNE
jgi:DNA-binding MarR family transcriptional regulator